MMSRLDINFKVISIQIVLEAANQRSLNERESEKQTIEGQGIDMGKWGQLRTETDKEQASGTGENQNILKLCPQVKMDGY